MTTQGTPTVREALRASIAEILYRPESEIDDETAFIDLGLDSVLGVELVLVVNRLYGLDAKIQLLWAQPTVRDLSAYITAALDARGAAEGAP